MPLDHGLTDTDREVLRQRRLVQSWSQRAVTAQELSDAREQALNCVSCTSMLLDLAMVDNLVERGADGSEVLHDSTIPLRAHIRDTLVNDTQRWECIHRVDELLTRLAKRHVRWGRRSGTNYHMIAYNFASDVLSEVREVFAVWPPAGMTADEARKFYDQHLTRETIDAIKERLREHHDELLDADPDWLTADVRIEAADVDAPGQKHLPLQDGEPSARHSADFASVNWFGTPYTFAPMQAACVKALWEAWENKTPVLREGTILEATDHAQPSETPLRVLFQEDPAWGTLIVPGDKKGTFRLAEPTT